MNREQAEKWLKDHDKKPFFDPMYGFLWGTINPVYSLPNCCFDPASGYGYCHQSFPSEEIAMEWAIQELMKLPDEPEVDVHMMSKDAALEWDKEGRHNDWFPKDAYQDGFIAGFEAGRKQE